jgi:hypothetical protein
MGILMNNCQDAQVIQGCYNGNTQVSIHYIYGKDAAGHTVLNTVITDAAGNPVAGANATNTTVGACPLQRPKFRAIQPLNAGSNTITHSLNLPNPISSIVDIRDNVTNETILARVSSETDNTLVITVTTAVSAARITII